PVDRRGRARAVPLAARGPALRHEPRGGLDLAGQLPHSQDRREVADSGRRQPGHGRRVRRRQGAVARRPLQRRGLRDLDEERESAGADPGRRRPARGVRLAAAGPLLARAYRGSAVTVRTCVRAPAATAALRKLSSRARGRPIGLLVGAFSSLAIGSLGAPASFLGRPLRDASGALAAAQPLWLLLAGTSFALALVCSGCAWRSAFRLCGCGIGRVDACARYGVGSLVNSLLPGNAGGACRIVLFSRALPAEERLWVAGGVPAAVG